MLSVERVENILPERIVVLENPFAKNGHRGHRQLADLLDFSSLPFDTIQTSPDPSETAGRLGILEPTDLLYVIGGDGTNNSTIEPLMTSGALTLPTRGGNANDLAIAVNGYLSPWRVYSDYLEGDAHDPKVHPIEVTVTEEHGPTTQYNANNYASIGYAALASHMLNQPLPEGYRRMLTALPAQLRPLARIPLEGYRLLEAARISQRFGCRVEDGESFEQAADITVVHSERMAKLGRFNVRHFDGHVFSSVLEDGGMLAMGRQFVKMMRGKMAGENVIDRSFKIDNPSEHPLYLQVDGEATPLPNSARVNFGLSEGHIRILSAKLHDRAA